MGTHGGASLSLDPLASGWASQALVEDRPKAEGRKSQAGAALFLLWPSLQARDRLARRTRAAPETFQTRDPLGFSSPPAPPPPGGQGCLRQAVLRTGASQRAVLWPAVRPRIPKDPPVGVYSAVFSFQGVLRNSPQKLDRPRVPAWVSLRDPVPGCSAVTVTPITSRRSAWKLSQGPLRNFISLDNILSKRGSLPGYLMPFTWRRGSQPPPKCGLGVRG